MSIHRTLKPYRSALTIHRGFMVAYGAACLCMMVFLSWSLLSPDPYAVFRDSSLAWLEHVGDLISHLAAFSLCSSAVLGLFPLTGRQIPFRVLIGMMSYCLLLEGLQSFVPGRHCDARDAMANLCGFVLGVAFVRLISMSCRPSFVK